jgi:hypothetical protein
MRVIYHMLNARALCGIVSRSLGEPCGVATMAGGKQGG